MLDEFQEQSVDLLLRKGVYPYDYMDSLDHFNEPNLPPQTSFNNKLKDTECTDSDYQHAHNVWNSFHCKTFQDYHDLYLKSKHYLILYFGDVKTRFNFIHFLICNINTFLLLCSGCTFARGYLWIVSEYVSKELWFGPSSFCFRASTQLVCYAQINRCKSHSDAWSSNVQDDRWWTERWNMYDQQEICQS